MHVRLWVLQRRSVRITTYNSKYLHDPRVTIVSLVLRSWKTDSRTENQSRVKEVVGGKRNYLGLTLDVLHFQRSKTVPWYPKDHGFWDYSNNSGCDFVCQLSQGINPFCNEVGRKTVDNEFYWSKKKKLMYKLKVCQ